MRQWHWTVFASVIAGAAQMGGTAQADNYGAIAFSRDTGGHGYSYDYGSRAAAENSALERCPAADCTVVIWFRNACGALAVGTGNGYGTGWASSRAGAETIAMNGCNGYTTGCSVRAWSCTTR